MHQPPNKRKQAFLRAEEKKREEIARCYEEHTPIQVVKAQSGRRAS